MKDTIYLLVIVQLGTPDSYTRIYIVIYTTNAFDVTTVRQPGFTVCILGLWVTVDHSVCCDFTSR